MRLLAATVRNYRIHREKTVVFDAPLCLIGGPNESGKSTFVEAVHRGLFLKSRTTGDALDQMRPTHQLDPTEVEVSFEAHGRVYKVVKRFRGTRGTTQLTEIDGVVWNGDEAEAQLCALLGVEEVTGRGNPAKQTGQRWAHLWVWQGRSGVDPSEDARVEQTSLLLRLQEYGGAAALQSTRDAQIAARFGDMVAKTFTQTGTAKADSPLKRAESDLDVARSERERAAERLQQRERAIEAYEKAQAEIEECEAEKALLSRERDKRTRAYDRAIESTRTAQARKDLASAWVEQFDCRARRDDLLERTNLALRLERRAETLRAGLAGLPQCGSVTLEELETAKASADLAGTALAAMASEIEVLATDGAVRIGDQVAAVNRTYNATVPTDVHVGSHVHLRIHPGGGGKLADASENARSTTKALSRLLDTLGSGSYEEAKRVLSRRAGVQSRLGEVSRRLTDLKAPSLKGELGKAEVALEEARNKVGRLSEEVNEFRAPTSRGRAVGQLREEEDALNRAKQDAEDKKGERDAVGSGVDRRLEDARERRGRSAEKLAYEGSEDPKADLVVASERETIAQDAHRSELQRANAARLLHELFEREQKELADRFTKPLADLISEYVRTIFGPGSGAAVAFEDGSFSGIQLLRPGQGGALPFSALSGGAREQVSAAVRLAIAELLAAAHDGSLPVIFDDAFAFSDPDRVSSVPRMLSRAASRGLQVVVLTSNPSDYSGLGVHEIRF